MNEEDFNKLVTLLTKVSGGPITCSLFEAAQSANITLLKQVVDEGIDIYTQRLGDAGRPSPLHIAISNGKEVLAEYLVNNGVNLNVKDSFGNTPLMCAISKNLTKLTEILLEKGANINDQNDKGLSPLHIAVSHGFVELTRCLIGHGANLDSKTAVGFTPLHIVILNSLRNRANTLVSSDTKSLIGVELCKLLIGEGANLNITDRWGNTALHYAAKVGNFILTELFLFKGAFINVKNTDGNTPFHIAFNNQKPSLCIILLEEGASVDLSDEEGNTPLHLLFTNSFSSSFTKILLEKLIEKGANINQKNKEGNTALMIAIKNKSFDDIKLLLNRGADINVQNNNGETPLLISLKCFTNNLQLLTALMASPFVDEKDKNLVTFCVTPKKLVLKGANVNVQDNEGNTPLHIAYTNNLEQYIDLLLDAGSNVNVKNNSGNTPLHIAMSHYDKNFLDKILQKKIDFDVNIQNNKGNTPLHLLLMSETPRLPVPLPLLQMLIDHGAHVDIKNNENQTPFHISRLNSGSEEILIKHITKMRIAGLSVMISSEITNEDFAIKCLEEMERIKATKINGKHSLGILFSCIENPIYLANSYEFMENVMVTHVLEEMFPLYASLLRLRYKLASKRHQLKKMVDYSLVSRIKTMYLQNLPAVVNQQIFQYLENEDLKNIIKSMQHSKKMLHLKGRMI